MSAPCPDADPGFAELVAATNYSFLRGASHPPKWSRARLNSA